MSRFVRCFGAVLVIASLTAVALAGDRGAPSETVAMFEATESGALDVKVIPKNANQATILFTNKTDRPLSIQLPQTFVGIQAQRAGGIGVGGGGGAQAVGGGIGGGGIGGGGIGGGGRGGGGVFNVAPDAVRKVKVATVCLEHGKDDPKPKMTYELRPLEEFTSDEKIIEICKLLGQGTIDTQAAQAAVWHVAAGLSWQELASKVRAEHLDGSVDLYFSRDQLGRAAQLVQHVTQTVRQQESQSETVNEPYYEPASR